jgi:sialate O-acetylesterase
MKVLLLAAGGLIMNSRLAMAESEFTLLKGLADYQVCQRSATDTATLALEGGAPVAGNIRATVLADGKTLEVFNAVTIGAARDGSWNARLPNLPAGGPYAIRLELVSPEGNVAGALTIQRVLVGDLWILAGQSNMEGTGDLVGVEEPSDRINSFRMRHQWDEAREPLHRLYESVDRVHRGDVPIPSLEESDKTTAERKKGAGLGLPFAKQMVARTGIPVGLVPVAHGGTSMDQWSPNQKAMGGDSLYGSLLSALKAVGGKVKGVLWYQGESDTFTVKTAKEFTGNFTSLVEALRQDTGDPNLPFYYVQIGCFANSDPSLHKGWNAIQEQQRLCEDVIPNSGMAASIDLSLDDPIHIGVEGHKRLGKRLSNLALGAPSRGPRFDKVERGPGFVRVVFKGGSGKLVPAKGKASGFSIRNATGDDLCLIYKEVVDPEASNSVQLWVGGEVPDGALLWYGYGLFPFCNLADSEDMAVPVMGPIEIPKP